MSVRNSPSPVVTLRSMFSSWVKSACSDCDSAVRASESFCRFFTENVAACERVLDLIFRAEGYAGVEAGRGKVLHGGIGTENPHVVRVLVAPLYTVEMRFTVNGEGVLWCTLAIEERDVSGDQCLHLPDLRFKVADDEDYPLD